MDENLQNPTDTAPVAETVEEQGTVIEDNAVTPTGETEQPSEAVDKDEQKAQMRKNQIANQAKELEEQTGMKLEDLIVAMKSPSEPVAQPNVATDDVDFDKFAELTDAAVQAKFGDKFARLEKMDQYFAKLEAKEMVQNLPADYKDFEKDMVSFLSENKAIAALPNSAEIAYNFARGKNASQIAEKAAQDVQTKNNETEEVKKVAFIENGKSDASETTKSSIKELLKPENFRQLPPEERAKLLQSLDR